MRRCKNGANAQRVGISKAIAVLTVAVIVIAAGGLAVLYGAGAQAASTSTAVASSTSTHTSAPSSTASSTSTNASPTVTTSTASTTSSSSSSSSSTTSAGFSLAITSMNADVVGPGIDHLEDNETYAVSAQDEILLSVAGSSFDVQFIVVYSNCAADCPSHVVNVATTTPGFSVVDSNPGFPIPTDNPAGAGPGQVEFHFTVGVQSPYAPYNGELTLVATTQ